MMSSLLVAAVLVVLEVASAIGDRRAHSDDFAIDHSNGLDLTEIRPGKAKCSIGKAPE